MAGKVIIQAALIALAALGAGVVHLMCKPIDISYLHAAPQPVPPPVPIPNGAGGVPQQPVPPVAKAEGMIDLAGLKAKMAAPIQIIDAREPGDFAKGHIPAAFSLPMSAFFSGMPDTVNLLSRDIPIVVYCGGGDCDASKFVAKRLKDMGFSQMFVYEDGFTGWTKAGMPVESGGSAP